MNISIFQLQFPHNVTFTQLHHGNLMIVHQIGNASAKMKVSELSDHVDIDEPLHQILLSYFTSAISGEELYHLHNDIGL